MASNEEELAIVAIRVIDTIESGEGRPVTRRELFQTTTFYESIGNDFLMQGDLDLAVNSFRLAVVSCTANHRQQTSSSIQEKMSVLLLKIGECYARMGLFEESAFHLELAARIYPQNFDAKFHLAVAFCMVGRRKMAKSLIQNVLSQPSSVLKPSIRQKFIFLQSDILAGYLPEEHFIPLNYCEQHQSLLVDEAVSPKASMTEINSTDTHTPEPEAEGAHAGMPPQSETATTSRRKKSRSRSRSGSRSRQPRPRKPTPPRKPSKKEMDRLDKLRQKDMERVREQLLAKKQSDEIKEKKRRERRDTEESNTNQFPTDTDLRHVVPGWGGNPIAKKEKVKTKQTNQSAQHNDSPATEKKKATSLVPNIDRENEVLKQPAVPKRFAEKFALCFACPECYITTGYGHKGFCYQPEMDHACKCTILMVKRKSAGFSNWIKVRTRPRLAEMKSNLQFSGRFKLCAQYQEGIPCQLGEVKCTFCHSEEEREIWTMDVKVPDFTLSTLIAVQQKYALEKCAKDRLDRGIAADGAQSPLDNGPVAPLPSIPCPFQLEVVCGTCWQMFGVVATQKGNNCHTTGVQHRWESHRAFLLRPENELIRAFDSKRTQRCGNYQKRGHCPYGNSCNFIHGDTEQKLFSWMSKNKIKRLDDIVTMTKAKMTALKKPTKDIPTGNTQTSAQAPLVNGHVPSRESVLRDNTQHFCKVCNERFLGQLSFDQHCTSRQHEKNLLTDKERPWRYRPPPWGGDFPRLCNGLDDGSCPFAGKPDMYNKCRFAHSTMELDEWKERTDHFKFRKSMMHEPGVFSYVHSLQEEFAQVKLESDMMMKEVEGVRLEVTPGPLLFSNRKNASHSWTFTISSQVELKKVSLLHDESRLHFRLSRGPERRDSAQVEDGITFLTKTDDEKHYTILVNFNAGLFGSFKQKVIFDFGTRPLLAVALDVEVGSDFVRDEILKLRKELPMERWTSTTHTVRPFLASAYTDPEDEVLLCRYKPPDTSIFSQDSLDGDLNHNNYIHRMRILVDMEELERTRVASKFNVVAEVKLSEMLPGKAELHAPFNHLFGRVPLTDCQLSEDSDTGYLMLHGAVTAWVGPSGKPSSDLRPTVYEAQVVCEANFGFDGRGKDHFYVCLSKCCCEDLSLKAGQAPTLSVQLQIDRLPMCRMRYGLDQLPDTSVVFPDLSSYVHISPPSQEHRLDSLNQTQQEVVDYMTVRRTKYTPPLVVYGPFGSGKTETLALATEEIVKTMPNARILICALNDSAADLYITHYLWHFKAIKQEEILRVYSPTRWANTVPDDLQRYCQKEKRRALYRLKLPDLETVIEHKIIVTTLATSLMLTDSNMRGCFSHIIIDEAGQCLECEAILPITLATSTTCVVLAGDYRQLGPKSFSTGVIPNRLKMHVSILKRLVLYYLNYDEAHPDRLVKLLKVTYRSHPKIMAFVSEHFYDNAIECRSKWGAYSDFEPLSFYATHGNESTDRDSTSYYNVSEVDELVEQITKLYNNWPQSWGERSTEKMAVLTPYSQQVKKVTAALVKANGCFSDIKVSTVPDIQGAEFYAVFLSTVRTYHGTALGDTDDTFGFFSDMMLVNTAITRAKCQVAVVGNPSSLTSFGRCMNIWRSYIDWCSKDGCLYPRSLTLSEIRLQAESLRDKLETKSPMHRLAQRIFDIGEMEPDEIIQNLKEKQEPANPNNHLEIIERAQRTIYRFTESQSKSDDQVVYKRKKAKWKQVLFPDTVRQHKRDNDDDDDVDSYQEEDDEDEDDDSSEESDIYQDCNEDQMLKLLKKDRKRYKRCIMTIEGSSRMFGRNISRTDKVPTIAISSRLRCNRSFDGDEVVIEIIPTNTARCEIPQGRVVGILKKAMECKNFLCRVDPYNHSILIPLNRGIPKIYNLTPENGKTKGVAVYSSKKYRHCHFERYQQVDHCNPSSMLFIVRYLKWEAKFYSPLGIVIDVIPAPTGLEDGEVALALEYNLRPYYQMKTREQVSELYSERYTVPESVIRKRVDFRDLSTFTIDPKGSKDFDDALSIMKTPGELLIGIHIADVSYFVPQNSPLDIEAKLRCVTYYPPNKDPVAMLPPRLSAELCSLQPKSDRLSVSILLHVSDKDFTLLKPTDVERGVICSKAKLTYEEAQQIIDMNDNFCIPREIAESVRLLNKVATAWRHARLGDGSLAFNPTDGRDTDAHRLIEEMMIRANHEIAQILTRVYSDVVPLRLQQSPNVESLSEWFYFYHGSAQHSLSLQTAVSNQICECLGACNCGTNAMYKVPVRALQQTQGDGLSNRPVHPPSKEQISITYQMLSQIETAIKGNDDNALKHLIATSMLHPESAVAELAFREIQELTEYRCSGDIDSFFHASLNLEPYSHFTSPIRRYIDIVAHRLVTTVNEKDTSYSQTEVRKICDRCNQATKKQKRYDKAVHELKLNVIMKEHPLVVYPVVDQVQEASFHLRFPTLPKFAYSVGTIRYSDLNLQVLPIYDETKGEVILNWEDRIYDYKKYEKNRIEDFAAYAPPNVKLKNLDPNRFVTQIPVLLWHQLLHCIKENNMTSLRQKSKELLGETNTARHRNRDASTAKQYDESETLELKVFPTQVHHVQLSSKLCYGRLTAQIQLFNLTDSRRICIEHHQHAITCFSQGSGLKVTRDFGSVSDYIKRWKPLLKAEAAFEAISHRESYILKNIPINWTCESDQFKGEIKLNAEFCEDNQVFEVDSKGAGDEEYLCVRYDGIAVPPHILNDDIVQTARVENKICFIGHCLVTERSSTKGKNTIQFVLHQSAMPFPRELLARKRLGTIQVIAMSLPMRRMLLAIHSIDRVPMAQCLALGKRPTDIDKLTRRRAQKYTTQSKLIKAFVEPNCVQERAVSKALTEAFTVIHGPPGTGKTVTGVRIAYMFAKMNKEADGNKKVLYCGPSNKSVEVIIDYLKRTKDELVLVRVYSDDVVQLRFPVPTHLKCPRRLQSSSEQTNILRECRHEQIALHTLIRDDDHCLEYAGKIREYDKMFADEIVKMRAPSFKRTRLEKEEWKKHIKQYHGLVKSAAQHVLANADIILVTCIGSATQKVAEDSGELISQVIIDEAGMCTEPESMVPLTSCNPQQVVLIGDHMQLQPIVMSELAQRLGMKRSMFARYVRYSDMLTIQYRMHEAIAKLPSMLFYDDKLQCGLPQQGNPSALQGLWAGGQGQPITFVDIRGEELSQVIMTADGNEQSKYNPIEATYTARVVTVLMRSRKIRYDCIQVLSQYRAHCKQIREQLSLLGANDCEVTTVTKSQGSEVDYVVLSTVRSIPTEQIEMRPTFGWLRRNLGTVADKHQLNVAITRARKGLIIIGNRELLSTCSVWRQLFAHYQQHRAIVTPDEFFHRIKNTRP